MNAPNQRYECQLGIPRMAFSQINAACAKSTVRMPVGIPRMACCGVENPTNTIRVFGVDSLPQEEISLN